MTQQPIVQQPTTPQQNLPQQIYPQLPSMHDIAPAQSQQPTVSTAQPLTLPTMIQLTNISIVIMTKIVFQTPASSNSNRRPQGAARNLQYAQRTPQGSQIANVNGISIDSFRLLSVLGRGHFGKVILSQYKKSGKYKHKESAHHKQPF